jgi:hypothetical protein
VVGSLLRQLGADLLVNGAGGATFRFGWQRPEAHNYPASATEDRTTAQAVLSYPSKATWQEDDFSDVRIPDQWSAVASS